MKKLFNILKRIAQVCLNASIIMGLIGIVVLGGFVIVLYAKEVFDTTNPVWERLMYGLFFVVAIANGYTSKLTYNYSPNQKAKVEIGNETK